MNMSRQRTKLDRFSRIFITLATMIYFVVVTSGAVAHNLQTKMVYMFFDPNTQQLLDARIDGNDPCFPDYQPPDPLLRGEGTCTAVGGGTYAGDELGLIIKVVPRDGTTTGVGGHVDFYVPNGLQVIEVAYVQPGSDPSDGLTGYDKVPMKGQSLIAVGDGPVGAKATAELIGLSGTYTNYNLVTEDPVVTASGLHRGTIAGVYGDTGIFYATDPDLSYGSWQRFTDNPDETCGTIGVNLDIQGVFNRITNNSGDTFVPCNKWDAEQMFAWGTKGTTCTKPGCVGAPIVDYGDGRGNAPWGFAAGTGGPQSGYGWNFNWDEFVTEKFTNGKTQSQAIQAAMSDDEFGPWKRIKYPGSRISFDQPGLIDTTLGIASIDAGNIGLEVSSTSPLPLGTDQLMDDGSPKAIRWAVGQLTLNVPEYVWVKVRVKNEAAVVNESGCPVFNADTFGGDAGGDNNGKDHLWRYYEPTRVTWNACVAVGKPTDLMAVKPNQTFPYKVKLYNAGEQDLTNVKITDTLPSGVTFISSVPLHDNSPTNNPLVWNIPVLQRGDSFEAIVNVKATGTGLLDNKICVTSDQYPEQCSSETTPSGGGAILKQYKTASVGSVAPGGTFDYTLTVENIGGGPSGSPIFIQERLEAGITFQSLKSVTVNGASYTGSTVVGSGPDGTEFTVPTFIPAGGKLLLTFTAKVSAAAEPGEYCNSFTTWQNGLPLTTGSLACVNVGGGKIGGNIFRDWIDDGAFTLGEEGIAGITLQLLDCGVDEICGNGDDGPTKTTTTNANGDYLFEGLAPDPAAAGGTKYRITVVETGSEVENYAQTVDPDGDCRTGGTGTSCPGGSNVYEVTITEETNESLDNDFGYRPSGSGAIGDLVYETLLNDGTYDPPGDVGINGVKVFLYEDSNGNGIIDADDIKIAETTTANVGGQDGSYSFTGLAEGLDYIVQVPRAENTTVMSAHFSPNTYTLSTGLSNPLSVQNLSGTYNDADFGFFEVIASNIGGRAYQEEDGTEGYNPGAGDVPIANVTVWLRDSGGAIVATTTTDANGLYEFTNVVGNATYTVDIDQADPDVPTGYSPSRDNLSVYVGLSQDSYGNDFPFTQLLSKTADIANPSPGDTVTYTITPNYTGENLLTNAIVYDYIPTNTTFVSAGQGGFLGGGSATDTIDASKDTFIRADQLTRNYGACAYMRVGRNNERRGLVQFDLDTIPATATITSATLRLTRQVTDNSTFSVSAHQVTASWNEGTQCDATAAGGVTWSSFADAFVATAEATTEVTGGTTSTYEWDITTLAQKWLDGSANNYGVLLKKVGTPPDDQHDFDTLDSTGTVPQLVIEYTNGVTGAVNWALGSNAAAIPGSRKAAMVSGSYTGNGTDNRAITGLGFQPSVILIKASTNQRAVMRTSSMAGDASKDLGTNSALESNLVQSLDSDGFTVGDNARVNSNAITYHYIAFRADPADLKISSYLGTGSSQTISTSFQPDLVIVMGDTAQKSITKNSTMGANESFEVDGGGVKTDRITAFTASGFTVGNHNTVGTNGVTYHYVAWRAVAGRVKSGTYTGNATDNRNIGGAGFSPDLVWIKTANSGATFKGTSTGASTDESQGVGAVANFADSIQALQSDGFQVGTDARVNGNGGSYYWTAFDAFAESTTSNLSAAGTLVSDSGSGGLVTVTLELASDVADTNVDPTLSSSDTGIVDPSTDCTRSPSGAQPITAGGTLTFTWSCSLTAGTLPDSVTFTATTSSTKSIFANATSNSVIITPPLTFQVTVDDAGGFVTISNTATINEDDGTLTDRPSNTVTNNIRSAIGDTVFVDWDKDGIQDAGEPGISGVTVELDNGNCTPLPDAGANCPTTTTDGSGRYRFSGLLAGDYTVNVISSTLPAGYTPVSDLDGIATPHTASLALGEGDVRDDVDFGYRPTGASTIGDTVFEDVNTNGVYDSGTDKPIAGVTVELYYDSNGNGTYDINDLLYATDVTDSNGIYGFGGLPAGTFFAVVDNQDPALPDGLSTTTPTIKQITDGTSSYDTVDFPFTGTPQTISKTVDKTTVDPNDPLAARTLTYTLDINYRGTQLLDNLKVEDQVPGDTTYIAASANLGGTYDSGTTKVTWELGGNNEASPGQYTETSVFFAFRGDDTDDFWSYTGGAWSATPADPTGWTVKGGGSLVLLDGLLYALRGDDRTDFGVYDPALDSWDTGLATAPGTVNNGGALTTDGNLVFALRGDNSTDFWAYDPDADSWDTGLSPAPGNVQAGGSLVFDGTYIYALQGATDNFWRYNIATDNWIELSPYCDADDDGTGLVTNAGGALTFDGTFIYGLRGANTANHFCRYNITTDTWTALADMPANPEQGAALAFDGTSIYALEGNANKFHSCNVTTTGVAGACDTGWTTLATTSANVKWGGAIRFVPDGVRTLSRVIPTPLALSGSATCTLGTDCPTVSVTLRVTSLGDDMPGGTTITPPANLTVATPVGTAVSTQLITGPTPATDSGLNNGEVAEFVYVYQVKPNASLSEITFAGNASTNGTDYIVNAVSASVIVAPSLTFQASVNTGATTDPIVNVGTLFSSNIIQLGPDICYTVADETDPDTLVTVGRLSPYDVATVGDTGTTHIESLVWSPDKTVLYTTDRWPGAGGSDHFGTLDPDTGVFTGSGVRLGSLRIPAQSTTDTTLDVDAMSFDPATGRLYAVNRREVGNTFSLLDTLFQINPATGRVIQDAFGAGVDGIPIRTDLITPVVGDKLYDVDGIAFDPVTGTLYGIANTSPNAGDGLGDHLVIINKNTGAVTDVGRLTEGVGDFVDDMEGISMFDDGTLYGVTGDGSAADDDNSFWVINKTTAAATHLRDFPAHSDYESIACLDGPTEESIGLPPTNSNPVETYLSANIGNLVWNDLNGDGLWTSNEPGIAGVQVCATSGATTVCDITDSDGEYRIAGLDAGTWTVAVNPDTVPVGVYPTLPTSKSVTLTAGQQYDEADFAYTLVTNPSSIGDTVWVDNDNDGLVDAGEFLLEGVTVRLIDCGPDNNCADTGDNFVSQTTTTDANGFYTFNGLPNGDYLVQVDETRTIDTPDGESAVLSDVLTRVSGHNPTTTVAITTGGTTIDTVDFGYNWDGQIGDFAWYDTNGNGLQDETECSGSPCPVQNVTILLYIDANGNGEIDPTEGTVPGNGFVETDANGAYLFSNLPPGDYVVKFDEQTVESPTSPGTYMTMVATTGSSFAVTLGTGDGESMTDLTADAGFIEGTELEGHVFHDENNNGVLDGGETRIPGVEVTLTGTDISGNPISLTTTTDADGEYKFVVPPSNAAGYTITYDNADVLSFDPTLTSATTPTSINWVAVAGTEVGGLDFGVDHSGVIGDRVWNDVDGDGVQDAGEPGLSSVTVQLYLDADGDPATTGDQTFLAAQATDGSGNYSFVGLEGTSGSEKYVVKVDTGTVPAGFTQTGDPDEGSPPACTTCDSQAATTLAGGGTVDTMDFGYTPPGTGVYPVTGNVFKDDGTGGGTSDNGAKDGTEGGIAGVTVELWGPGPDGVFGTLDDVMVASTTTDGNGDYTFPSIADGNYEIRVDDGTLPSTAYEQTGEGTAPGVACSVTCDSTVPVTVSGGSPPAQYFGYNESLGSIAGTVCDGSGDGFCDSVQFDTALGNVTVTLTWSGDDGILGTADDVTVQVQTDSSGNYIFDGTTITAGNCTAPNPPYASCPLDNGLLPGIYQIAETNPTGYLSLADADGGNPDNISVNLAAGQVITDRDFEDTLIQASIGDFVWLDSDGDGVQDNGEPGLANVDVELWLDSDGSGDFDPDFDTLVETQQTDNRGNYLFENVGVGDYFVNVVNSTIPTNLEIHPALDEPSLLVSITGPEDRLDIDFGYVHDDFGTGERYKAILGDRIWADADGDGVQDAGEAGIEGVALTLRGAGADGILGTGDDTFAYTITGPSGDYLFTNLDPDTYVVEVDASNFDPGGALEGFSVTIGPQSEGDDISLARTLLAGDIVVNVDFGYDNNTPGVLNTISDKVWFDFDGEGDYDAGTDEGIAGVTVVLYDSNGYAVATTQTDANGDFSFTGIMDGDYEIRITDNTGELVELSGTNKGGALSASDVYAGYVDVNGDTLTNSDDNGVIRGLVDVGGDGSVEAAQVTVKGGLLDLDGDGFITAGDTGTFGGVTVVNGVITDADFSGTWFGFPVTVSGADVSGENFGYNIPGSIGDTVWSDHDGDQIQDPGEVGVPGVVVRLFREDGTTPGFQPGEDTLVAITFTDSDGKYLFEGIQQPGTYYAVIDEDQLALDGYTRTTTADFTDPLASLTATLTSTGATYLDADFGYQNTALADLSGNVWNDLNRNAVIEAGEPDLAGVTIALVDPNGVVVSTAVTDVNGDYTFYDVPPGDYTVEVTDTDKVLKGFELTSSLDEVPVTVAGADIDNIDFGYARKVETGAVGDRVWLDANGDGIQSPSEQGLSGVTVQLYSAGPDGIPGNGDDVLVGTDVTDVNGNYLFDGLPADTYYVTVANGLPASVVNTAGTSGPTGAFVLSESQVKLNVDFGYKPSASTVLLGDTVWFDSNGNGVQDPGEAGIGGVDVKILDSTGALVATVTTDADGTWIASGLPPGSYTVFVDESTLPASVIPTPTNIDGDTYITPVLTGGQSRMNLDFGYTGGVSATIGDVVFLDQDKDGQYDAGEGLSGVRLLLYDANDLGPDGIAKSGDETVLARVTTDADGRYQFTGLQPGDYYVAVDERDLPNSGVGLTGTTNTGGYTPGTNAVNGYTADISLLAGQAYADADFGYVPFGNNAIIGDRIWSDSNGDGVQDAGEIGIAGVTVDLVLAGTTTVVATTTTASDGSYQFLVSAGSYDVIVTDTAGVLTTYTQTGDPDEPSPPACTTCDDKDESVTVAAGAISLTSDFGYQDTSNAAAFVGDTVYLDLNGNGHENGGEPGIEGVTVSLYGAGADGLIGTADDVLIATDTTDASGNYGFSGLPAGQYNVVVTDVANELAGLVPTQSVTSISCTGTTCTVTGDGGTDADDADFGFAPTATLGTISDEVFLDADKDGFWDAGEGIAGVTVNLYDPGPDGVVGGGDDILLATTTTDSDGKYAFSGLPADKYYVDIDETTLPTGGADLTGTIDTGGYTPGTNANNGTTSVIDLLPSENWHEADFGYVAASGAIIGDRIWSDANGNGLQDPGEAGIGGVTVDLVDDSTGAVIATATTAADGSYLFTNVPADTYNVVVTDTAGALSGYSQTGDPDESPPACTVCDGTDSLVTVAAGDISLTSDFGYRNLTTANASIGDTIYHDTDGDGTQDAGEGGIPGVTVKLLDSNGDVVATTITDANGNYDFTGLEAGDYTVEVTDVYRNLIGLTETQAPGVISLATNEDYNDADFGFAPGGDTGSIGDTIYFDADGDGIQDAGEAGISGVTLNLYEAGPDGITGTADDVLVATETTDANGNYTFDGLEAGEYRIEVTDQNMVLTDLIGTQAPADSLLISCPSSCTDIDDADFGYKPTVGGGVSNIGGTIWLDSVKPGGEEGTLQPEESGIQGVEVELWLDDGDGIIEPGTDNLVRTTITDANGDYNFLGLPPGTYIVRVPDDTVENVDGLTGVDANPALVGLDSVLGPNPTQDSNGHLDPYAVVLPANTTDTTIDFAYDATVAYTLEGTVFEDNGGEGTLGVKDDGTIDPRVEGVTILLYRYVGGEEYLIGTTTTDNNGNYSFGGLPAGDYRVKADISGTTIDGMTQTYEPDATDPGDDCTTCDATAPVTLGPNATAVDFGFWNGGVVTTPVTLSYFEAQPGKQDGEVHFEWATASEAGNLGFDIYVLTRTGAWERVNEQMIPNQEGLPVEIRQYSYFASGVVGDRFMIVDTDIFGQEVARGPFKLGKVHGVKNLERRKLDWKSIKSEHEAKKELRKERKKEKMKEKLKKQKEKLDTAAVSSGYPELPQQAEPHWAARVAAGVLSVFVGNAYAAELPVTDYGLMRLEVTEPGVQRVTYEDLEAAGLDLADVKPGDIGITNQGEKVAIRVEKGPVGDGKKFGPGWYIDFVGEPLDTLYTKTNVYRLYLGKEYHAPMGEESPKIGKDDPVPFYLETVRVEEESAYNQASPVGDPWYMAPLLTFAPKTWSFPVQVDDWAGPLAPVTLEATLWGHIDFAGDGDDHHVIVGFNGEELADEQFDGISEAAVVTEVPAHAVVEGENLVTFRLPVDMGYFADWINVDRYAVTYPRQFKAKSGAELTFSSAGHVFEVADLDSEDVYVYRRNPQGNLDFLKNTETLEQPDGTFTARFAGMANGEAEFFVVTGDGVNSPALSPPPGEEDITSGAAEYLIIAHPDFIGPDDTGEDPLNDLALARQADGLSVRITDVEQVYAQFGHGIFDAQAIRDYIAYAAANMGTTTVLLVGGDTLDYHGYLGQAAVSFIPSLYAATGSIITFAPVDPLYADIDADNVPELAIGRFPVRTSGELRQLLAKTWAWEYRDQEFGDTDQAYTHQSLFIADGHDLNFGYNFKMDSEDMIERLPQHWQDEAMRAYIDDLGVGATRSTVIDALNDGVALTSFVGHSGATVWTFDGIFLASDAVAMTNTLRPTIVTQWGCWNTFFVEPLENTMAHEFLLNGEQGAAAVLGASTLTEAEHEQALAKLLYDRLLQPGTTLGQAVLGAKTEYAATNPDHADVILGWTLLGDPGLVLEKE